MIILYLVLGYFAYIIIGSCTWVLVDTFGESLVEDYEDLDEVNEGMIMLRIAFWPLDLFVFATARTILGTVWVMRKLLQLITGRTEGT